MSTMNREREKRQSRDCQSSSNLPYLTLPYPTLTRPAPNPELDSRLALFGLLASKRPDNLELQDPCEALPRCYLKYDAAAIGISLSRVRLKGPRRGCRFVDERRARLTSDEPDSPICRQETGGTPVNHLKQKVTSPTRCPSRRAVTSQRPHSTLHTTAPGAKLTL